MGGAATRRLEQELPHILVVDDDARLLRLLRRYLAENGFLVATAQDAEQARATLRSLAFDLIVVDVMMPGEDGIALTRWLKASGGPAVLMLTAKGDPEDRIRGLEAGAEDYLPKPFDPRELLLRINNVLGRARADDTPAGATTPAAAAAEAFPVPLGHLAFDPIREELLDGGVPVRLTSAEARLLSVLVANAGEVLSREALTTLSGITGNERTVDVQVTRLRRKIETDPRQPRFLHTVRGEGYILRPGR